MTETTQSDIEVKIPEESPYQVLPPLSEEEYSSLESDILESGIQEPVTVDEDGIPIDGYTRTSIGIEHDIEIPTKVKTGLSEQEKRDLAYRLNLNRRHMGREEKQEIIRQYLLEDWDGDNSDGWSEKVANTLGVGGSTVRKVFAQLRDDGKFDTHNIFSKEEERRQVREFIQENPGSSNREVSKSIEADVSHATVGNWRNEWETELEEEESEEIEEDGEETPTSFTDFSNLSDDETPDLPDSFTEIDDPTEVTEEEEEDTPTQETFSQQIQDIEMVEVEIEEGEIDFTLELPEKTYERAEEYASNFGYETVEDLLVGKTIPEFLNSVDGKETITEILEEKARARGY